MGNASESLTTLIDPDRLAPHLEDPRWAVVDCRFDLARPEAGEASYLEGHIPGAIHAHLDRDLSGPRGPLLGRHPLPDADALARTFGRWGIGPGVQVVAYDAGPGMFAARLWWLLRWLGHDCVAVLDGGLRAWRESGRRLETGAVSRVPREFVATARQELCADTEEVERRRADPDWRVLDARAAARYAGEVEPIDPVAGHVPGAHNYPYEQSVAETDRLHARSALGARLEQALGPVPPERAILMCGSGVTACHVLLAMAVCGLDGARLYPGSWSEWIRDPARPIATGHAP
jgi:thiosulfate/3-mercaptopyruvate sulfurtransferase